MPLTNDGSSWLIPICICPVSMLECASWRISVINRLIKVKRSIFRVHRFNSLHSKLMVLLVKTPEDKGVLVMIVLDNYIPSYHFIYQPGRFKMAWQNHALVISNSNTDNITRIRIVPGEKRNKEESVWKKLQSRKKEFIVVFSSRMIGRYLKCIQFAATRHCMDNHVVDVIGVSAPLSK